MAFPLADPDARIRFAAFEALAKLTAINGPVLSWNELAPGFVVDGTRILFANQARGIFKPAEMKAGALSIKTTVPRTGRVARYDDKEGGAGAFRYRLQGEDPNGGDNRRLRLAFEMQAPLIYFVGVKEALYRPLWPVFVTAYHPEQLSCTVQLDDATSVPDASAGLFAADAKAEQVRREYVTVLAKRRLHQDVFRENVLSAYSERCAICRFPRKELLDAAHIVPDSEEMGDPVVNNGLALCRLHHGAYDTDLLGIRPDGRVVVSKRLRETVDGPTLEHGLKKFHDLPIELPRSARDRPDPERLRIRFDRFEITALTG